MSAIHPNLEMTDFNYKNYSLENLENWMHDAMSSDSTPTEIYECICNVVRDNYYHHKQYASHAYELLKKLNINPLEVRYTDEELDAMCDAAAHADMISTISRKPEKKAWVVPVEEVFDNDTYETNYTITFPQDMLDHTGWMEGDEIEWIDRKDGTFEIRKVGEPK